MVARPVPSAVCVLLVGVLVLGPLATGPASAAPPPRPVCAACGDALEQRADELGLAVSVADSTATVTVHEDGTATWVVRNEIREGSGLDRLRANETLRETLAGGRYWDPEVRSVTVTDGGVLVARYDDPAFAERSVGGSLRSGAFTASYGYRNLEGLGADRLTVVAPEGMRVAQTVPGASVSSNRSRTTLSDFDSGGFVTFVPRDAPVGGLVGWLAIADLLFPVVAANAAVGALVPALVLGSLVGVGAPSLRRVGRSLRDVVSDPGRVLAVLGGAVVAVSLLLALGVSPGRSAVLFGLGTVTAGAGVAWPRASARALTYRRVLVASLVGWAVAGALAVGVSVLFHGRAYGLGPRLPGTLALFGLVPAGFALQRGARWWAVLTVVVSALVGLLPLVPLTDPFAPFGYPFRLAVAGAGAAGFAVVGVPFLLVGSVLADSAD